jgi:8-oxo-dGTP pyrophosphatase MutT (NUDIX family)
MEGPLFLPMLLKIYFYNKPLFLTDTITKDIEDYLHRSDAIFIEELSDHAVRTMIYEMQLPDIYAGVYLYKDVNKVLEAFKKELECIQAAGGFVYTSNKVLLIFRRGKWDLPKGKLDEGEDLETCAIREIKEETGVEKIQLEQPLTITYHTYYQDGKHILKESHWFLIKAREEEEFAPQTDEDIEKCEWVPFQNLGSYMSNTHSSIADVVRAGLGNFGYKISNF